MNKNEIQILIDHYLEGTTTPEEDACQGIAPRRHS